MKNLIRLCTLLMFILAACSPVRQVLKNPKYFREVADSVVKRGYCINDTVVETEYVELVTVKDSLIHDSSFLRTLQSVVDFDTTFPSGIRITIDSGKIQVYCKQKTKVVDRVKTVTQTVRDRKLEDLLKKEIETLKLDLQNKQLECNIKDVKIGELQNKVASLKLKIYSFLLFLVLYIVYKVYKGIRPLPV